MTPKDANRLVIAYMKKHRLKSLKLTAETKKEIFQRGNLEIAIIKFPKGGPYDLTVVALEDLVLLDKFNLI